MSKSWVGELVRGVLVLVVALQVFVMNYRLGLLMERVEALMDSSSSPVGPPLVSVGDTLAPVKGQNARDLAESELTFGSKPSVVFFISPNCPYCTKSVPYFGSIRDEIKPHANIFAIGSAPADKLRHYAVEHVLAMEVYSVPLPWLRKSGLTRTPTTVVVSSVGRVEGVWTGALTQKLAAEITRSVLNLKS